MEAALESQLSEFTSLILARDGPSQFQMLFSAGFPSFSVASSWGLLFSGISSALLLLPFSFSHRLQNHKDVGIICGFPPPTSVSGFEGMSCHQFCYKHGLLLHRDSDQVKRGRHYNFPLISVSFLNFTRLSYTVNVCLELATYFLTFLALHSFFLFILGPVSFCL